MKLEELAEKTGISKSALASYENEENRNKEINHGNLITLADFYEVSIDYLFCRTENREHLFELRYYYRTHIWSIVRMIH